MRAVLKICWTTAFVTLAWSQEMARTNPFDTPDGLRDGKALFQLHCSYCHGATGEGGRGADLTTGQYRHGGSDASLYASIRNGIPGTEMPAVRITDDEVWKLTAFVKSLGTSAIAEKPSGDAVAGKALYEGKGGCTVCHSIGPEGGNLGPDLGDIGRRRNLKYLEESIVTPNADVPIRYRTLEVLTTSGQTVTGIRLNEDDISIQLRDTRDNLRSFLKTNIREMRHDKPSLMPSYANTLNKKEIDDVVAYLSTLRGGR
jgi:putative heme-binding domain-containing protein